MLVAGRAAVYPWVVQVYQDVFTRFQLWASEVKDIVTLFILVAQDHQDIATRYVLVAQVYQDVGCRFKLITSAYPPGYTVPIIGGSHIIEVIGEY